MRNSQKPYRSCFTSPVKQVASPFMARSSRMCLGTEKQHIATGNLFAFTNIEQCQLDSCHWLPRRTSLWITLGKAFFPWRCLAPYSRSLLPNVIHDVRLFAILSQFFCSRQAASRLQDPFKQHSGAKRAWAGIFADTTALNLVNLRWCGS